MLCILYSTISILKFIGSGILATGVTVGTAIFYAGRNQKTRDEIESKIPYSKNVLTAVYGEKDAKKNKVPEFESMLPAHKKSDEIFPNQPPSAKNYVNMSVFNSICFAIFNLLKNSEF